MYASKTENSNDRGSAVQMGVSTSTSKGTTMSRKIALLLSFSFLLGACNEPKPETRQPTQKEVEQHLEFLFGKERPLRPPREQKPGNF
jgi:hypothetical protein